MSSVAISAPSAPAATAIQSDALARSPCGCPADAPPAGAVAAGLATMVLVVDAAVVVTRRACIDVDGHRHAGQQHLVRFRAGIETDANGHALDDLREVARRVVGGQQREL